MSVGGGFEKVPLMVDPGGFKRISSVSFSGSQTNMIELVLN